MTLYAKRNPLDLDSAGGYYTRHLSAMTAEALDRKSAIAAELAWRDMQLAEAEVECDKWRTRWNQVMDERDAAVLELKRRDEACAECATDTAASTPKRVDRVAALAQLMKQELADWFMPGFALDIAHRLANRIVDDRAVAPLFELQGSPPDISDELLGRELSNLHNGMLGNALVLQTRSDVKHWAHIAQLARKLLSSPKDG